MGLKKWTALLLSVCLLLGCAKSSPENADSPMATIGAQQDEQKGALPKTDGTWKEIEPGSVYDGIIEVNTPEAPGTVVYEGDGVTVDASHTEDGYIMVKCEPSDTRLKARVILGDDIYTYDMNQDGEYEVFPLQMGNGLYEFRMFRQVEGTSYSEFYFTQFEVDMPDTKRVFVYPSQYVWYTGEQSAVKLSYDLCAGLESDAQKEACVYDYIVNLLSYDYEKAANVESGYIPDLEEILKVKKGICFDYSALYAAMLRAQDIPVRLVIGYVQPDNIYHAWNQVCIDGEWIWRDSTFGPDSAYTENNYIEEREY